MLVYHAFKHVLKKDDKTVLVNEREWGEAQLTGQALEEFRKDFKVIDNHEEELVWKGEWNVEILLTQHPYIEVEGDIPVGVKIIFPNVSRESNKPTFHQMYYKWLPAMLADQNLIYVSPVWVSE